MLGVMKRENLRRAFSLDLVALAGVCALTACGVEVDVGSSGAGRPTGPGAVSVEPAGSGAGSPGSRDGGIAETTTSSSGGDGGSAAIGSTGAGSSTPVDAGSVSLPLGGPRLFAGADDACYLSASGHVACWGSNETGQLGLGDFTDRRTPTWIPALSDVVDLAVADFAICALKIDGSVWCAGMNFYGELSVDTPYCQNLGYECSATFVHASSVPLARALFPGDHGLLSLDAADDDFSTWGAGPGVDAPGNPVVSAAAGYFHTCLLLQPGAGDDPAKNVVCFGDEPAVQPGQGRVSAGGVPFTQLAAGDEFTCGVGADQKAYCWGDNLSGELGVGVSEDSDYPESCTNAACAKKPTLVAGLPPVAAIAAHFYEACALTTAGDVYCWGAPSHTSPASSDACYGVGPLCMPTPRQVLGVSEVTSIGVGYGHSCALGAQGDIHCWGLDTHGQLGRGQGPSFEDAPVSVTLPAEPE